MFEKSRKNVAEKFGGKEKSRTFAAPLRKTGYREFLEKDWRDKKLKNFAEKFGD